MVLEERAEGVDERDLVGLLVFFLGLGSRGGWFAGFGVGMNGLRYSLVLTFCSFTQWDTLI